MKRRIGALFVFLLIVMLGKPALAQTYSMSYSLEPNAWLGAVNLSWSEVVAGNTVDYSADNVAIGPQIISFNGSPPPGYAQSYAAYCVDLYHWDQSPSTVYVEPFTALSNLTDNNAASDGLTQAQYNEDLDQAAWLYDTYNPTVQSATGQQQQIDGAALQWAIWDVIAGPTFTVTNANSSQATQFADAQTLAANWYGSVGNNLGDGTLFQIDRKLQPNAGQDLLGPLVTPESSSLALLAFALAAPLMLLAARKARRARS